MALAVLITVPIGFGCYALMTRGYAESYQNTVDKTKVLNDTAVAVSYTHLDVYKRQD